MARRKIFDGGKARDLREGKGIELRDFVTMLGANPKTGKPWHRDTLTNVELGHHQPSLKLSHAWHNALDVPWPGLLMDAPEPSDTP